MPGYWTIALISATCAGLLTAGAAFTIDHDSPTMTTQRSINRHPRRVKVLVELLPSATLTAQREPAPESPAVDDQTEHLLYSFLLPPEPLESLNGGLQTVQRAAKMNLNLEPSPWAI